MTTITREHLELAAKAAGYAVYWSEDHESMIRTTVGGFMSLWQPSIYSAHAWRLAMDCKFVVDFDRGFVCLYIDDRCEIAETFGTTGITAMEAVTLAAAEIGRAMK